VEIAIPLAGLLVLPAALRVTVALSLLFLPIFFAAMIFATSFKESRDAGQDLGANILGAVAGGCLENLSVVLGYRYLLVMAALLYALSYLGPRKK